MTHSCAGSRSGSLGTILQANGDLEQIIRARLKLFDEVQSIGQQFLGPERRSPFCSVQNAVPLHRFAT